MGSSCHQNHLPVASGPGPRIEEREGTQVWDEVYRARGSLKKVYGARSYLPLEIHTHTHSLTHFHTHILACMCTQALTHTHIHSYTRTLTLTHSHTLIWAGTAPHDIFPTVSRRVRRAE